MSKFNITKDEEDILLSQENVRVTRSTARRLGSVERDVQGTPKRSQSMQSLDVISEDGSPPKEKSTRGAKKALQLSPIREKDSRTATPTRRTRKTSALLDSPQPQSRRSSRRLSALGQSVEDVSVAQNGHTTREVTFNESPEQEKQHQTFPKTPKASKIKETLSKRIQRGIHPDKQPVVVLIRLTPSMLSDELIQKMQDNLGEKATAEDEAKEDETATTKEEEEEQLNKSTMEEHNKSAGSIDSSDTKEFEDTVKYPTSWTTSVSRKSSDAPIDAFGVRGPSEDEEEEQKQKIQKDKLKKKNEKLVAIKDSDEDDEEEEEEEKCEFVDDEAMEASDGEDSMDPEEREYLEQNEIPEGGEEIGSEDTYSENGGDEEEAEENDDFIVFSDKEVTSDEQDSLDELEEKAESVKKARKRIVEPEESTDDEVPEAVSETVEFYKSTSLTKFSGMTLSKLLENPKTPVIDHDVTMISLASTDGKKKKTPRKSECKPRSLEEDLADGECENPKEKSMIVEETSSPGVEKKKTPQKSMDLLNISREKSPKEKLVEVESSKKVVETESQEEEMEEESSPVKEIKSKTPVKDVKGKSSTAKEVEVKSPSVKEIEEKTAEEKEEDSPPEEYFDAEESDTDQEEDAHKAESTDSSDDEDSEEDGDVDEDEEDDKTDEEQQTNMKNSGNDNTSDVLARCNQFLMKRNEEKAAQKQINEEKKAKRRAAKEKKQQRKKEMEEKLAEQERIKQELKEKKMRLKQAIQKLETSGKDHQQADKSKKPQHDQISSEESIQVEKSKKKKKEKTEEASAGVLPQPEKVKKKKKFSNERSTNEDTHLQEPPKKKKKQKQAVVVEENPPPETQMLKKKKVKPQEKEPDVEPAHEAEVPKVKKQKKRQHEEIQEVQIVSEKKKRSNDQPKRLPLSLHNQPSTSGASTSAKRKRTGEDGDENPTVKRRSIEPPKTLETKVGTFLVTDKDSRLSAFSQLDLIRKARVTKQFKRERKMKKKKKEIPEPSLVFPQVYWPNIGTFTVCDFRPDTKVLTGGGNQEFVVKTLETKKNKNKKASATTVEPSVAGNAAMNFKESKLYGTGTSRESSKDLIHRKIKKCTRN
ncbi:probable serine/threonine-protein kinase kinX isoform X2 [Lutzomyia longipalpis]|uniref:probable serine/threonine-protein kinase kinX isoform X2 n=1 Tax=Lutzomyia longipalpis TaxID=7200 RepID=UPI0024846C1A|nr:probable serine/threonine-protein kinase kinX isoform X2 [Lutzomyia longipalpis]